MKKKGESQTQAEPLESAREKSWEEVSKRLAELEGNLKSQEKGNKRQEDWNRAVIIGVPIAAVLIVAAVAAEVIISTSHNDATAQNYYSAVQSLQTKVAGLQEQVDLLKARNPYLR